MSITIPQKKREKSLKQAVVKAIFYFKMQC